MTDEAMLGTSGYPREPQDTYNTPIWCVERLLKHVILPRRIWEPACGAGNITKALRDAGKIVFETDISKGKDFLKWVEMPVDYDCILTNPPYKLAMEFIEKALELTRPTSGKVAMLLRNEYDCAKSRKHLFSGGELFPFVRKVVLTKRPRWIPDSTGAPRHNYAWFCWNWLSNPEDPPTISYA